MCVRARACMCVWVNLPWFSWHVWFHASLPDFLSPLPVSCRYFIPISTHMCPRALTHTHTQTHTSAWGCELQRVDDVLWSGQRPLLSLWTVCVAACSPVRPTLRWLGGLWGCRPRTWVDSGGCRCAPQRTIPLSKNTAASLLVREVLTVSVSSSNSGTSGQWGLKRQGGGGDCDTTAIEDLRGAGFCMGSGVGYGVRM